MTPKKSLRSENSEHRILLVDDHPVFRLGMKELINGAPGLCVCGEAEDASIAMDMIETLSPDLAVVDITLKNSNGIELIKQIHAFYPALPVLVVSMHDESLYAERALMAGAKGYVMKQEATLSIVSAIEKVMAGQIYTSDQVKDAFLLRHLNPAHREANNPVAALSDRELEVFTLFGRGLSSKEIAARLHLSIKTIGTYRERIKQKLHLKHFSELISYATDYSKQG